MTLSCRYNASNLAHVLHGILEKHKRHNGVELVVFSKGQITHFRELSSILELSVQLVIEGLCKVSKHKWLGVLFGKVLVHVVLGEGFLAQISSKTTELCEMFGADKSISIDSFTLVHPKFGEMVWFFDSFNFGG